MSGLGRREFVRLVLLGGAGAAAGLIGCRRRSDYTDDDVARLERRIGEEAERSGKGPYGELRFRGYRELAKLPYFRLDADGGLRVAVEDLPQAIDFHTHLGVALLFAPAIDLHRQTSRTQYFLDCDRDAPGCLLDLDLYINSGFTEDMHRELSREIRGQLLLGGTAAKTHTIPNLLAEMDAMKCGQAAVLAIAVGLPFGHRLTETWMEAIEKAGAGDRLLPFASVNPRDRRWRSRLRGFAERGARGVKLHPEMQSFFPDDDEALEIYEECGRLGLPVIFHAGRSGIEPEWMRRYALPRYFARGAEAFPQVQFVLGHAGARDSDEAVALARRCPNVWLEIAGQGVTRLDEIKREVGAQRLVFGSDWPFYPLAPTLAKVLLITEGKPAERHAILRGNAERIFAAAKS